MGVRPISNSMEIKEWHKLIMTTLFVASTMRAKGERLEHASIQDVAQSKGLRGTAAALDR